MLLDSSMSANQSFLHHHEFTTSVSFGTIFPLQFDHPDPSKHCRLPPTLVRKGLSFIVDRTQLTSRSLTSFVLECPKATTASISVRSGTSAPTSKFSFSFDVYFCRTLCGPELSFLNASTDGGNKNCSFHRRLKLDPIAGYLAHWII